MRVAKPWIKALKERDYKTTVNMDQERDLSPKKMSSSYHRLVRSIRRMEEATADWSSFRYYHWQKTHG